LGTGEWKVKKLTLMGNYVQSLTLIKSRNEKIIYKFYPTEERAKMALKLGEVDKITGIFSPKPLDSWKTLNTEKEIDKEKVVTLFFNTQDKFLSEKSLRQALAYAIDKSKFEGERAISSFSENSWYFNPQVKPYNFDLAKAKEMIEGLAKEAKPQEALKLVTSPNLLPVAEEISKKWNEIGIKNIIQVSSVIPDDFQIFLAVLDIPKDPDQYAIWHSTQTSGNISNYKNPRIDKLLEDGRAELNQDQRRKIYLDFQRFLVEDCPAAFLYHPYYYTIYRK